MINDNDKMMKNVEIQFTFVHKFFLFQKFKFQKEFESSKQNFKKRTFTKKLIDIIKNDVQFNKLIKINLNQSIKNITMTVFSSCFDAF